MAPDLFDRLGLISLGFDEEESAAAAAAVVFPLDALPPPNPKGAHAAVDALAATPKAPRARVRRNIFDADDVDDDDPPAVTCCSRAIDDDDDDEWWWWC